MTSADEVEVELGNHSTYYAIACRHFRSVERLVGERDAIQVQTDDDVDIVCEKNSAIQRDAIVAVLLSALTLEAFINHYGISKFSASYFYKHLDGMSIHTKWLLLPKLVTGKQLSTDGQEYEALRLLFRRRDKLVHYKVRRKKVCDLESDEDWTTETHASEAVRAVRELVAALGSLDPSVDTTWLDSAETDPFA